MDSIKKSVQLPLTSSSSKVVLDESVDSLT